MSADHLGSVAAGTAADAQHVGAEAQRPHALAFELEEALWRAAALNDLATWVGRAMHFVAKVRQASQLGEGTNAWLRANGIEVPEWLDRHALGLEALHREIDEHSRMVREIVGLGSPSATAASSAELPIGARGAGLFA